MSFLPKSFRSLPGKRASFGCLRERHGNVHYIFVTLASASLQSLPSISFLLSTNNFILCEDLLDFVFSTGNTKVCFAFFDTYNGSRLRRSNINFSEDTRIRPKGHGECQLPDNCSRIPRDIYLSNFCHVPPTCIAHCLFFIDTSRSAPGNAVNVSKYEIQNEKERYIRSNKRSYI